MAGKNKSSGKKSSGGSSSVNPKPKMGASGGKPDFWHDCLMYGAKPWDDEAPDFWHGLNKELAKMEKLEENASHKKK